MVYIDILYVVQSVCQFFCIIVYFDYQYSWWKKPHIFVGRRRMGRNKDIDTTAFRHAIWHYVHCIYGVRHDDYNYGVINDLLERNVRSFVKLISCFPEKTTHKDYRHFMTEFMQSEKASYS